MKSQSAVIHFAGYLASSIGLVVGVSMLSYIVNPEHYGLLGLYIATATLFQYLIRESIGNAFLRHSIELNENKSAALNIISDNWLAIFLSYTICCSLILLINHQYSSTLELLLAFILCGLLGLFIIGECFLSAILRRDLCAIHMNISSWLRFLFAAMFYYYVEPSVTSLLTGFIIAFSLSLLYDIRIYKSLPKQQSQSKFQSPIFNGTTPFLIGLSTWWLVFFDRIIAEEILGAAALGQLMVLLQIAYMPIFTIMRAASSFLFPLMFSNSKPKWRYLSLAGLAFACLILTLFLIHEWLFSWIVGVEYRHYSWLLPIIFLSASIQAFAYITQANFFEFQRLKTLLFIKLSTGIFALVTGMSLGHYFQLPGLVIATLASSLTLLMLTKFYNKKSYS